MKYVGEKIRKTVCAALIGAMSYTALAQSANLEIFASKRQTTTDAKAATSLTNKLGLFVRSRVAVDNKDLSTSHMNILDLTYKIGPTEIYVESQATGGKIIPRLGIQKSGTIGKESKGHLDYYVSGILSVDGKYDKELFIIAKYEKKIAAIGVEYIANTSGFAVTRARAGYHKGKFETGIGYDRYATKHPGTCTNNLGAYFKKTF